MKQEKQQTHETEWEVVPGPGGWAIGWFKCRNCGYKSGTDDPVCPNCKAKMKKIKWG